MSSGRTNNAERPIVSALSLKTLQKKLLEDMKVLALKQAQIKVEYKLWRERIGAERYSEYKSINEKFKRLSSDIVAVTARKKAYEKNLQIWKGEKQKQKKISNSQPGTKRLGDAKHGLFSKSSAKKFPLVLPTIVERDKGFDQTHLLQHNDEKATLKPIETVFNDRSPMFFGGDKPEIHKSISKKHLPEGSSTCASRPSLQSARTKPLD